MVQRDPRNLLRRVTFGDFIGVDVHDVILTDVFIMAVRISDFEDDHR
jgi:hypothetical protein